MATPSTKTLQEGLGLDAGGAKALKDALVAADSSSSADAVDGALLVADTLLEGYGIEAVRGEWQSRYWQDTVALYVNRGDSYKTTLMYDVARDKFVVGSIGDWIERNERFIQNPKSELSLSAAQTAFAQSLGRMAPKARRDDVMDQIVQAVLEHPIVLAWFQQRIADSMKTSGKPSLTTNQVEDVLGEAIYDWKAFHGVEEKKGLSMLSADPALAIALQQAVLKSEPVDLSEVGASEFIDYGALRSRAYGLLDRLQKLKTLGTSAKREMTEDAIRDCEFIAKQLKRGL